MLLTTEQKRELRKELNAILGRGNFRLAFITYKSDHLSRRSCAPWTYICFDYTGKYFHRPLPADLRLKMDALSAKYSKLTGRPVAF